MVIGIVGVLKAGGAYVPIDPEYPDARIRFMLEDSQVKVLLTQRALLPKLVGLGGRADCITVALDGEWPAARNTTSGLLQNEGLENLAYMIYTSGSTGNPKGAMITHRGLLNRLQWMQEAYQLTSEDRVLQKTPFSFDVSVPEFLWPLMQGARLVIARPGGHRDPAYLSSLIAEQGITTVDFVPSMLQVFLGEADLESCSSLRRVLCAGEALSIELKERFFERLNCRLYNLYGPTEAAIYATHWECRKHDGLQTVPIGYPVANTQIFILDREMKPVPAGVSGELYISGEGLARGYSSRPILTAEKFVPNPFVRSAGQRMYKTGDLARYRKDGSIEYLGRLDHQVKVRGFRIELGEVEAVLLKQPGVEAAAVIAKSIANSLQLVGYYVPGPEAPAVAELKKGLSNELPDYMVPAWLVAVSEMPLTASGKIDRKELIALEVDVCKDREYVGPRDELEAALAQCWSEVLGVENIGIHDSFFAMGGHSLLAIQLVNKMNLAAFQCSIRDLYDHPTIEALSDHMRAPHAVKNVCVPALKESYPLLPVQLHAIGANYERDKGFSKLTPTFIDLIEEVDEPALIQALDVWYKQSIFSLRFKKQDDEEWRQFYQPPSFYDYCPIDEFSADDAGSEDDLVRKAVEISHEMGRAIDIYSGPTLRVALLRKQGRIRYMIWLMDHLIADNISFFMLFTNFKLAYKQIRERHAVFFPQDTVIGRWAAYLSELAHQGQSLREVGFWRSHFSAGISQTESEGENRSGQGQMELEHRVQRLDKTISHTALAFLVQQGFSFEQSCLGNFLWAFKSCFPEDPARLCMVSNGRDKRVEGMDLSQGMGWFSIHYPALFHLSASGGQMEFLREVVRQHDRYSDIKENYGALRYLNRITGDELEQVEDWTSSVVFNCMGEVTTPNGKDDVVRLTGTCMKVHIEFDRQEQQQQKFAQNNGGHRALNPSRRVHFSLSDGAIQIIFSFCKKKVDSHAVENLLQTIQQSFAQLVS
jgi:amino acid adenylation domain-containing protein